MPLALNNLMGRQLSLLRHVPKGAINAWGKAAAHYIKLFLEEKTWEVLATLLAYPKCTLGLPHCGGRKSKDEAGRLVRQRLSVFAEHGWLKSWQALKGDPRAAEAQALAAGGQPPG